MCDGYFHVCEVPWRPEGAVDSLVLELEVVVICLTWVFGAELWTSERTVCAFNY